MTITVNQPEKVHAVEGQKMEFKTSAFYAPGEHNPGFRQMRTIAETVAAFMNADGGVMPGTVVKVGEEHVTMDFNHQMAGKDLHFTGEILKVREATEDELKNGLKRSCGGCQGGNCGDGGCEGGNCGDGNCDCK